MLRRVGRFYSSLNLQARPLSKGLILPVDLSSETQSIPGLPDATVEKLKINNKPLKPGQSRTLYQEIEGYDAVTVLNLRQKPPKKPTYNNFNESNEFVRNSIAKAIQDIKTSNVEEIQIFQPEFKISNLSDNFYNLAAEAGFLTTHSYKASDRKKFPNFDSGFAACSGTGLKGKIYAESQNLARDLMETPANLMTPEIFAQTIQQKAVEWELDNVEIIVRDQAWIQEMKMGSFLSVSQGSEIRLFSI